MRKVLLLGFMLLFAATSVFAQGRVISGTVASDEDGETIPGASVLVKGTSVGVATDMDGRFTLTLPENANYLVISAMGFETQELEIGNRSSFEINLSSGMANLDEVVVQAPYGSLPKTAFTGSEATVSRRGLEKQQVTSFTRALEGLVPGIQATSGSGPGSNAAIRVRGFGSVNASNAPLYVLDGVPFTGSLNSISNDDIETVTVLKDAAAAALYGARAANGVIMITTRRGKKGRPQVNVNLRTGMMNRFVPEYERVGERDYYELMWEGTRNALVNRSGMSPADAGVSASNNLVGNLGGYNAYNVPNAELVNPQTGQLNPAAQLRYSDSWSDEVFRTATRNDFSLNASGAVEKADYYFSMGYIKEEGITKFSDFDRFNMRLNVNSELASWLKGGINVAGAMTEQANLTSGGTATINPFFYTRNMGPIYPIWLRDEAGGIINDPATGGPAYDWGDGVMGVRPYAANSNILGSLSLDNRSAKIFNASANTFLEARFLKDFTLRTTLGSNFFNSNGTTYQNSQFGDAANVTGRSTKNNNRQLTFTFNQVLNYQKKFGEHFISALAGHENYSFEQNFVSTTRTGFPFPGNSELAPAANLTGGTSYTNLHRIESYFSSINYNFRERYLLSASIRRDGSSRFATESRWGNFWSLGAGWRLTEEAWFRDKRWLDELKFKVSYGEQGNEGILNPNGSANYFAYQSFYGLGFNNFVYPGAVISSLENRSLNWEKNQTFNMGFDFGINQKLEGTIEVFQRNSTDLLFDVPLPASTGISSITSNVGRMRNRGIELNLGWNAIRTMDFDYRIDLNLTHFTNVITELPQEEIIQDSKNLQVGKSLYEFWIREYAGVDPDNGDALYYKNIMNEEGDPSGDRETTNVLAEADRYFQGSSIPDLIGGLTNSFRYKNLELSVLTSFQVGGLFLDNQYSRLMHPGNYGSAMHVDILNRWQQPGDVTDVPRLENASPNMNGISSRFLIDASYVNIRNITLGYKLPNVTANRLGIRGGVKVFGSVDNALLFSQRSGMDPQTAFDGVNDAVFPPYRTFTLGLNVNL
ncbi:SusC/RagA family TonB-linked outer membrane protein [Litoribacter populi]|uniref:SusC/RagA family TonB-linked outer membrane protein n=1 Tax=Litoribacter populi TaxID=2598460 RepID=UPI00117EE67E|nr:SusC/RagA family TonB-linked outer membrane protein [Litoribacter populi]